MSENRYERESSGRRSRGRSTVPSSNEGRRAAGRSSRTDTLDNVEYVRRKPSKKKKRRKGSGGTVVLILLILLVITGIVFVISDGLSGGMPFLRGGVKQTLKEAEKLAQTHDYDGAIAKLQSNEKYGSNTELQDAEVKYESARAAYEEALNGVLASAQARADEYDYKGAADVLKASEYYNESTTLQTKAAEYEEAEKNKGNLDEKVLAEADRLAAMYDYDAAIEKLKSTAAAQTNPTVQSKIESYEAAKAACVAINPEEVTHIFYHSLIADPSKGFRQDDSQYAGMMQWMTTVDEFDRITQSMYDRGYVLVSIYDLFTKTKAEDGSVSVSPKQIYLPEGKKAYVMSLDDLSYYHTYDNHGIASKIVLDEEGKPICEYIEDDGTVSYGDYDVVPRLDTFIENHPDACYRGARGIIALTGYNGILGYRTDGSYSAEHNTNAEVYYTDPDQLSWLEKHPDFDWEQECAEAKRVAEAMKAEGWTFASHTWGHHHVADLSYEKLVSDTERWQQYVAPLIGGTDAIIFAHGQDLSPTGVYDSSNEKYMYLKGMGFDVFCNVDSTPLTTTVAQEYFHQGRRNLDGYRIYQDTITDNPLTSDLFNASEVLDPQRPGPVPEL